MRAIVIGLIFAAVILAGGTAYMLRSYLTSQEAEFAAKKPKAPTVEVMVASTDMPLGTVINEKNVEWLDWPEDAVQKEFLVRKKGKNPLTDLTKTKHVTRRALTKGEPVTMARLYKSDDPGFLRGSMAPGMRAVAVRTSAETAAGGFILPGDRVDVILTHSLIRRAMDQMVTQDQPEEIAALENTSETIIEDLRVLAVDQKVNEFEGGAKVAKTILLEVTPKQAEKIYTAKSMGKISLTLRSAETGEPRTGHPFTTDVEISPILSAYDRLSKGEAPFADSMYPDSAGQVGASGAVSGSMAPPVTSMPQTTNTPSSAMPSAAPSFSAPTRTRKITVYRGPGSSGSTSIGNGIDPASGAITGGVQ